LLSDEEEKNKFQSLHEHALVNHDTNEVGTEIVYIAQQNEEIMSKKTPQGNDLKHQPSGSSHVVMAKKHQKASSSVMSNSNVAATMAIPCTIVSRTKTKKKNPPNRSN
jgi:hypothetical protein